MGWVLTQRILILFSGDISLGERLLDLDPTYEIWPPSEVEDVTPPVDMTSVALRLLTHLDPSTALPKDVPYPLPS